MFFATKQSLLFEEIAHRMICQANHVRRTLDLPALHHTCPGGRCQGAQRGASVAGSARECRAEEHCPLDDILSLFPEYMWDVIHRQVFKGGSAECFKAWFHFVH